MKREDILLALKEAEEKTRRVVENARKESEHNIAKAKQDAADRVMKGRTTASELQENLLAAKLAGMEDEANIIRQRGQLKADKLKRDSEANIERAIERLIEAFERDIDV